MAALPGQQGVAPATPREAAPADGRSVRRVVEQHAGLVARSLRYLGVGEQDLEDAAQEVFVVVHRKLGGFQGRSSLQTWLYGICLRVAKAHRRKAARSRERLMSQPPEPAVAPSQHAQMQGQQARQRLLALLGELDEDKRAVFVLYEIERKPMKAVAEALGCPLQTAYYRHQAARRQILAAFEGEGDQQS